MTRVYRRTKWSKEEIEEKRKAIRERAILFELEIKLEEEMIAFRDLVLKRLDDTVTLDDILDEMMEKSLCKRISVWKNRSEKEKRSRVVSQFNPR